MIDSAFQQFVKKNNYRLTFFVLVGFFISEHGFAQKQWNRVYVQVAMNAQRDMIVMAIGVYDYSFGPMSEHGYLEYCKFEASVDKTKYIKLMEIRTLKQIKSNKTAVYFKNKFAGALIIFNKEVVIPGVGSVWTEQLRSGIKVNVPNSISENLCIVALGWCLDPEFKDMCYIRISGRWQVVGRAADSFHEIVYNLNNPDLNALKSNTQDTITKESEKDIVHILKDSETIVIKGAELGANIKVYNTVGVELQSTVSKSDAVNIKLTKNQLYFVYVGQVRYKVAM